VACRNTSTIINICGWWLTNINCISHQMAYDIALLTLIRFRLILVMVSSCFISSLSATSARVFGFIQWLGGCYLWPEKPLVIERLFGVYII
jgi:hypothetical protein